MGGRPWGLVRPLVALVGLVTAALPAAAHDFWIEPATFRPAVGEQVALRHRVGDHFRGDSLARNPQLLLRFVALDREGEVEVPGVGGIDPAGIVTIRQPGTTVVAYESRGSVAELDTAAMERYVDEEGIASQLPAGWRREGTVRDRFARSVKSLLVAGGDSAGHARVAGLPLELVPLDDPARWGADGALRLRLLHRGVAAPGVRVTAISRLDPQIRITATTDAEGAVALAPGSPGDWLVKAVRIVPAEAATGADYESLWTSLTFRAGD